MTNIDIVSDEKLPEYATKGSAGADIKSIEDKTIYPGHREIISTGLFMAIPEGYEVQIRSKSGLAAKYGVMVLNSPGTIDSDYRGEVKVILYNTGYQSFTVGKGDKIAQMVVAKVEQAEFSKVLILTDTARGDGGFGSTGK